MKKAIITVLGTIGRDKEGKMPSAEYSFHNDIVKGEPSVKAINTFPLLLKLFGDKFDVIPVFTEESLKVQKDVLEYENIKFDIEANGKRISENNYDEIFDVINTLLSDEKYGKIIIDISHGYRHLPVLATVSLIIKHFQDNNKIENILYAKEIKKFQKYQIIDLKAYLELANIAFILTTFNKNYTVGQHISSKKYKNLINSLNQLSDDIMALNLNNLFENTSKNAIKSLKEIENNKAVSSEAISLRINLEKVFSKEEKYYLTYFKLSEELFNKNYMLLSLAMLYESIRLYIKSTVKKEKPEITNKIEIFYNNDLYKVGDFFRKLEWRGYDNLDEKKDPKLSKSEYSELKKAFPSYIKKLLKEIDNKRNNLAHANSKGSFGEIKEDIKDMLEEYKNLCIKEKSVKDLQNFFN